MLFIREKFRFRFKGDYTVLQKNNFEINNSVQQNVDVRGKRDVIFEWSSQKTFYSNKKYFSVRQC